MKELPWVQSMGNIEIDKVRVGVRRREDLGDIDGLAKSIETYGLLHPIVIDAWGNLVAGHRRLEACRKLGWRAIAYREVRHQVTEAELRELELRENLDRKDFTELELSKNMAELAEAVKARLREKEENRLCPELGQNLNNGRPSKPDSLDNVAKETVHEMIQ